MNNNTTLRDKPPERLSPASIPIEALPVVSLSLNQCEKAEQLASQRYDSYRAINGGAVFGPRKALESHLIGILGEMAVADLYGVGLDTSTYEFGDGGSDLNFSAAELSTDVKTTATRKVRLPELLVRADKPLTADLYVRAHVIDRDRDAGVRVRIIGCATREMVKQQDPRCHPGDRLNHVVEPDEMRLPPLLG